MNIGTIREIKDNENRVGLTPLWTKKLTSKGHKVYVQKGAGEGAGFLDAEYKKAGAHIVTKAVDVVKKVDILVKVKEPLHVEHKLLAHLRGKTLYTYLHLAAAEKELTQTLLKHNITGIAYETVEDTSGRLPLLAPMSEVAGVVAVQYAAEFLQKKNCGKGVTLGCITGARIPHVVVMGAGVVGEKSALEAAGRGVKVTLFDINKKRLDQLKKQFKKQLGPLEKCIVYKDPRKVNVTKVMETADVIVGAVLVKGARAPKVVTKEHIKAMKKGTVVVDIAIDQGGCIWGSHPTSHTHPTFVKEGVVYCCVANIPGQYPLQSTEALSAQTGPHLLKLAQGIEKYCKKNKPFSRGINTYQGKITCKPVAEALDLMKDYSELRF